MRYFVRSPYSRLRRVPMKRMLPALAALLLILPRPGTAQDYPSARHGGNYMHNFYFPPAPSSTPWWPSWSPDGKWIAVAMSGSIWKVDPETGEAFELTHGPTYHSSPEWSPDGRWILYTADDGTTIQLEVLDVESGEAHRLTDDDFIYTDPIYSPDGSRVAYVSTRPNGFFNVYIRPIEHGGWSGDEIAVTTDNDYDRDRLYFGPWDMHVSPTWISSSELLLVSNRHVPLGSGNVVRVPAREDVMEDAVPVLEEQTLYRTRPDVSIDGKRFVYSSHRGDQYSNLYVQPTAGGQPYKLTFFEHDAFHPRWSPDGEWIAFISNEGGLPQLALLETYGGMLRKMPITTRHWMQPMGRLEVETIDAETGDFTAARIHLTASDGKFYAPETAYARVSGVGDHLFHQTGRFALDVPVGTVALEAVKGFEFEPARATVDVKAGETTRVTLRLERFTVLEGWYSGSTHVHMNYGGNLHNTLENLMMMSAAEDQDVVNEQIANKDNRVLDHQYFIPGGKPHPLSTSDMLLVVGQEYRPHFWGHVFMLGLRDHLISPFTTGYEGTGIESIYPSNTDMLLKAKTQGATVGYVHPWSGEADPLEGDLGPGKGFMVDAALGTTDAVEWAIANRASFHPWYAVLNNGLRVAAVGGEDSISDLHKSKLIGSVRTYVYTGEEGLDMDAWFEGLRQGRSFVSTGPLLRFTVDEVMPGGDLEIPDGGGDVEVAGWMRSITPLTSVAVVFNGETIETLPLDRDRKSASFRMQIPVQRSGWMQLRVEGDPSERYPLDSPYALAFTNPVWVTVGDRPVRDAASADYGLRWIDKLHEMAEEFPGWRSEEEKSHVYAQFDEARAVYRKLLREAQNQTRRR